MPSFAGRFEYLAPGRGAIQAGPCELSFDEQTVTLVSQGPPIAFDLGDIDVFAAADYELRLSLFSGNELRLTRFAKAFQDLLRELLEAYRNRLVRCLLVADLDEVARFQGRVQLESPTRACAGNAEIRLYESNVAVLPDAAPGFQWRLTDVDRVEFDEHAYAVVLTSGGERLTIGRLARRTAELADRVRSRIAAMDERSARVLHAVFPFLSPEEFRAVAATMREGTSAPIAQLRSVHRLIEPTLVAKVVGPALRPYVDALSKRCSSDNWYAAFKIIRRGADGSVQDRGPRPDDAGDDQAAGGPDEDHALDPAVTQAGDGLEVVYWFFFPLAAKPGSPPTRLAWEATSRGGRATYVFRLDGRVAVGDTTDNVNRALIALNFRREPIYLDTATLESELRYRHYAIALRKVAELARLRDAFVGRAIHTSVSAWTTTLDGLLKT